MPLVYYQIVLHCCFKLSHVPFFWLLLMSASLSLSRWLRSGYYNRFLCFLLIIRITVFCIHTGVLIVINVRFVSSWFNYNWIGQSESACSSKQLFWLSESQCLFRSIHTCVWLTIQFPTFSGDVCLCYFARSRDHHTRVWLFGINSSVKIVLVLSLIILKLCWISSVARHSYSIV